MKKRTWVIAAAVAIVAVAALAWAFAPRPLEVEVGEAVRGRFQATIDEDAKTRVRDRYVVSAPLAGQVRRLALREGDAVVEGDALAIITPVPSPMLDDRTLREQRIRVEIADAQVQQVAARIERAKVALLQARNEVSRSEQLAGRGFVSSAKLDTDRLAALAAQRELDAAMQERHVALHQLDEARAALTTVSAASSRPAGDTARRSTPASDPAMPASEREFVVRAPVAGRVLRLVQSSEGAIALGSPLLELADVGQLEIVAELLTTDALRTRPGSRVIVERWGRPEPLEGRVRRVEPGAFTKVSALGVEEQRVRVVIDLVTPSEQWRDLGDAYRVTVRVVTVSVDDAVLVPVSAVFPVPAQGDGIESGSETGARAEGNASGMAVFTLDGDRARLTPVRVGERNGSHAWVQDGLSPGARVIVYPPAGVRDGLRVKPRRN